MCFLGYSPIHKGYKCLHVPTGNVYISRDVVFDEHLFPFAHEATSSQNISSDPVVFLPSLSLFPSSSSHTSEAEGDLMINEHMPL